MIRTEQEQDYQAVFDLNVQAFGGRDDESRLIDRIRRSTGFIPQLSLVAEQAGGIVGHALFSKAEITHAEGATEVIVLAPIAVLPSDQKRGIGRQLIEEGAARSRELGYPLLLLIGHPSYYPKFGFTPARPHGLQLNQFEVPDDVFMVYELQQGQLGKLQGELKYPEAFFPE